jgi:hypothetical protein
MTLEEFKEIREKTMAQGISAMQYCIQSGLKYHQWGYMMRKLRAVEGEHTTVKNSNGFIRIKSPMASNNLNENSSVFTIQSPSGWQVIVRGLELRKILDQLPG